MCEEAEEGTAAPVVPPKQEVIVPDGVKSRTARACTQAKGGSRALLL